jgi:protein RecA
VAKEESLERRVVTRLNKDKDARAVHLGSEDGLDSDVVGYVSTQCATLDTAIGRPGVPEGRLTIITGREGAAKSTVLHHILAETQARGGTAILFDAENRVSRDRLARIGVDLERLIYVDGNRTLEDMYERMQKFITVIREEDPNRVVTIGLDSLAACATKSQMEGTYKPGEVAKLTSSFLREYHPIVTSRRICLIFVNQLRSRIDFAGGGSYGQDTTTMVAEGSLRYYASLRIDLRQIQRLGPKDEPDGILVEAFIKKSSVSPPFRRAKFVVDFLYGIDRAQSMLEVAKTLGLVKGGEGGWYQGEGEDKKFRSRDAAEWFSGHPEVVTAIEQAPLGWMKELPHA